MTRLFRIFMATILFRNFFVIGGLPVVEEKFFHVFPPGSALPGSSFWRQRSGPLQRLLEFFHDFPPTLRDNQNFKTFKWIWAKIWADFFEKIFIMIKFLHQRQKRVNEQRLYQIEDFCPRVTKSGFSRARKWCFPYWIRKNGSPRTPNQKLG